MLNKNDIGCLVIIKPQVQKAKEMYASPSPAFYYPNGATIIGPRGPVSPILIQPAPVACLH
jgi:hypothetical protein